VSRAWHILLVCSGNTCRSPLAAAMLRARLAQEPDLREITVSSAGTSAWDGSPASEGSYLVALERGLDLSMHRARILTTDQVQAADLILTMTAAHASRVADLGGASKVATMGEYARADAALRDVPDPFGSDVEAYRAAADLMSGLIEGMVERLREESAR
jgi:protein-tyrosine-phosphatase